MKPTLYLCLLLIIPFVVGCSNEDALKVAKRRSNLSQAGMSYHLFFSKHGQAPADAKQLCEFMTAASADDSATADAVNSLTEMDVMMIWNGSLGDANENAKYVLGFEASVPGSGGYIVKGDGFVELVTAKQFSAMKTIPQVETSENTEPQTDSEATETTTETQVPAEG